MFFYKEKTEYLPLSNVCYTFLKTSRMGKIELEIVAWMGSNFKIKPVRMNYYLILNVKISVKRDVSNSTHCYYHHVFGFPCHQVVISFFNEVFRPVF